MNAEQVSRLDNLYDRGVKNEVPDLKVVGPDEIRDIEPNCVVNVIPLFVLWLYGCLVQRTHIQSVTYLEPCYGH